MSTPTRTRLAGAAGSLALVLALAACASGSGGGSGTPKADTAKADGTTVVTVARATGAPFKQTDISVPVQQSIRAELPADVVKSGKLVIGIGALPAGFPPLAFVGNDQKTLTGAEPDFGRLVAAVLGLEPQVTNATWDNLFVGIDSGRTNVGFSNITDTEKRKEKYDFASYRQDNLGLEVLKSNDLNFTGDYEALAGKTVAVGSGTNQEKILLEWRDKLAAEGKTLTVKYFPDQSSTYLALGSGQIDAYFGPNPGIQYHIAQDTSTATPTRSAGTWSGAGETLQGLIAATTKKGDGLAKPLADAINYLIKNGQYATWLGAYNLANEAVPTSEVNPPGLPLTNS
jgi:polar amino acid transport system substrate-binding protein